MRKLLIEEWREIEGFPKYKISNLGRVAKGDRELKIMKTADKFKESYVVLHKDKKRHKKHIARLVYETFSEKKMKYETCRVLFSDGDKDNCRIDNLYVVLVQGNEPTEEQIKAYEEWCLPSIKKFIKDRGLNKMNVDVDGFIGEAAFFLWKYLPLYKPQKSSFLSWGKRYINFAFCKECDRAKKTNYLEMKG
jgi:hypothetical protein